MAKRDCGQSKCPLYNEERNESRFIPCRGQLNVDGPIHVAFVGTAPGAEEDYHNSFFVGPAGEFLQNYLDSLEGINYTLHNVVKCRPPKESEYGSITNRDPVAKEIKCCSQFLEHELAAAKPQVIVPLGNIALKTIDPGCRLKITAARGQPRRDLGRNCWVLPMFHPSVHIRGTNIVPEYNADFSRLIEILCGTYKPFSMQYIVLQSIEQVMAAFSAMPKSLISFDIETSASEHIPGRESIYKKAVEPICISYSWRKGQAYCLPLEHKESWLRGNRELQRMILEKIHTGRTFVAQNAKYEYVCLDWWYDIKPVIEEDTLLMDRGIDELKLHDLKTMQQERTPEIAGYGNEFWNDLQSLPPSERHYGNVSLDIVGRYNCWHSDTTLQIYHKLLPELQARPAMYKLYKEFDLPHIPVLGDMQQVGIIRDKERLDVYAVETMVNQIIDLRKLQEDEKVKEITCEQGTEFNVKSTKQLQRLYFKKYKLEPTKRTKTGTGWATGKKDFRRFYTAVSPIVKLTDDIIERRDLFSKYINPLYNAWVDEYGVSRTDILIHGTRTGRFSSKNPNHQNIKSDDRLKSVFVAPPGYKIVSFDHSQLELRVLAHLSQDKYLLKCYKEGADVHTFTTVMVFGEGRPPQFRKRGKMVNFMIGYGGTKYALADELKETYDPEELKKINLLDEAQYLIDGWYATYQGAYAWFEGEVDFTRSNGFNRCQETGREWKLPDINSHDNSKRRHAENAAKNSPVQWYAHFINSKGTLATRTQDEEAVQFLVIHDDNKFYIREDVLDVKIRQIKYTLENVVVLSVPLVVDVKVGDSLGTMKDYEVV